MKRIGSLLLVTSTLVLMSCGESAKHENAKPQNGKHKDDLHKVVKHEPTKHKTKKHKVHWGYDNKYGPEKWAELKPEFALCGEGTNQSPIDISYAEAKHIPGITFSYKNSPLKIINNGHTIQVNYQHGSKIKINGNTYDLLQFHFHTPSEHTVNGMPHEMEMHLVHKNTDGELAVVSVFMNAGAINRALGIIWDRIPAEQDGEKFFTNINVNAEDFLPLNKSYFHYKGSLTTPPCSEGVNWYVLETPIEVSDHQINIFKALFDHNARPVQPLNNRLL